MPPEPSYSQGTPSWVDLSTTDDEAAVAFYTALFGWEDEPRPAGPDMTYHMMKLEGRRAAAISGQVAEELELGIPPHWNTYITVADVDATTARVAAAGGTVLDPPFDVFEAGRMSIVRDPTGAVVAFWQAKETAGAEVVDQPGALCWNELMTTDLDRAAAFLTEVLGVEVRTQTEPMVYGLVLAAGREVAGIFPIAPEIGEVPPNWSVYFATADCDATAAQAVELGGSVVRKPFDTPAGRMAVLADPQGAVFQVIQLRREA